MFTEFSNIFRKVFLNKKVKHENYFGAEEFFPAFIP